MKPNPLPHDKNGDPIQVGSTIQNRDAEGTPNESPLVVSDTVDEIKIPEGAVVLSMLATGADLRFGDNGTLDGTADEGYDLVQQNERIEIPVANLKSKHVKRDAGVSVTLYFHFIMIEG